MNSVSIQSQSAADRTTMQAEGSARYWLLYIPLLLAYAASGSATTSYMIAWLGSFFIFFVSFTNLVKPTDPDVPLAEKVLRPLFLTQIIFAGYMSATSIFYFMDLLGYNYFTKSKGVRIDAVQLELTAACQRFYLIGHIAFVQGVLLLYKNNRALKFRHTVTNWPQFCMRLALVAAPVGFIFSRIGSLSVLGGSIEGLALVAATVSLAFSIPMRKPGLIAITGGLYGLQVAQALVSGFKEPVIVSVLMLGLFLYPFYKKLVLVIFIPAMLLLFTVLPTYVNTFRQQMQRSGSDDAKKEAIDRVRQDMTGGKMKETNWEFLTGRLSEISMFTKYKESVDANGGALDGPQILLQSGMALVPRLLWKEKPIMEDVVMVRVLKHGIIEDYSFVSAKPQYIVDGYLTGGVVGIFLALFLYGLYAQAVCNWCEQLFGGYLLGAVVLYTGIFRFLWRGNCFEFVINNMLYGVVLTYILWLLFKQLGIVQPISDKVIKQS